MVADAALLWVTGKQVFAHYVTPVLPFVFVVFAAGARAAFSDRRLRTAMIALAVIVCAGGVEATLAISRRIDARNGLAIHRAVAARVLDDCAATGRPVAACPARLDFGFMGTTYTYGIFARLALADTDPLGGNPEWLRLPPAETRRSAADRRGRVPHNHDRPGETLPAALTVEPRRAQRLATNPRSHYPEGIG